MIFFSSNFSKFLRKILVLEVITMTYNKPYEVTTALLNLEVGEELELEFTNQNKEMKSTKYKRVI